MARGKTSQNDIMGRLKTEVGGLASALGDRALTSLQDKVEGTAGRLTDYVEGGAGPGLMAAVTGAKDVAEGKGPVRSALGAGMKGVGEKVKGLFGGGKGGGGKKLKVTNIVESIDVGVPIKLAYAQWTQFTDFSGFMKKVETVEQSEDEKLHWKAQVFWSHREWDADIIDQRPEERIIWTSKGAKGHVDGAVTFHELGPRLTRILVVLQYHPQGFFERTGNLWRAQGRRVRLELKHFQRHVMTDDILHPDEIEGWRGVIEDGEVVEDHESAAESGDDASEREPEDEPSGEDYEDDLDGEAQESDDEAGETEEEDEDEEISPNGQRARERQTRRADGPRSSGRSRRPAGRESRSGRASRSEEGPQRAVRRRAGSRGGNSQ
jgi:uncharacterized membrane protein